MLRHNALTTEDRERLLEAFDYAARLHFDQTRKGTRIPYVAHLAGVLSIVLEYGGGGDEAIGALLHDAVEDQGGKKVLLAIREKFGEAVAEIVAGCTDSYGWPKPAWRKRKERYLRHVAGAPPSVLLVSAADKLHNTRSIVRDLRSHGDSVWNRFSGRKQGSLWYYRALVGEFRAAHHYGADSRLHSLVDELDRTVTEMETLAIHTPQV